VIERLPFDQFITRYDMQRTRFYLDPPYWHSEDDYGPDLFSRRHLLFGAPMLPIAGQKKTGRESVPSR
jgi:hypothetical protein